MAVIFDSTKSIWLQLVVFLSGFMLACAPAAQAQKRDSTMRKNTLFLDAYNKAGISINYERNLHQRHNATLRLTSSFGFGGTPHNNWAITEGLTFFYGKTHKLETGFALYHSYFPNPFPYTKQGRKDWNHLIPRRAVFFVPRSMHGFQMVWGYRCETPKGWMYRVAFSPLWSTDFLGYRRAYPLAGVGWGRRF